MTRVPGVLCRGYAPSTGRPSSPCRPQAGCRGSSHPAGASPVPSSQQHTRTQAQQEQGPTGTGDTGGGRDAAHGRQRRTPDLPRSGRRFPRDKPPVQLGEAPPPRRGPEHSTSSTRSSCHRNRRVSVSKTALPRPAAAGRGGRRRDGGTAGGNAAGAPLAPTPQGLHVTSLGGAPRAPADPGSLPRTTPPGPGGSPRRCRHHPAPSGEHRASHSAYGRGAPGPTQGPPPAAGTAGPLPAHVVPPPPLEPPRPPRVTARPAASRRPRRPPPRPAPRGAGRERTPSPPAARQRADAGLRGRPAAEGGRAAILRAGRPSSFAAIFAAGEGEEGRPRPAPRALRSWHVENGLEDARDGRKPNSTHLTQLRSSPAPPGGAEDADSRIVSEGAGMCSQQHKCSVDMLQQTGFCLGEPLPSSSNKPVAPSKPLMDTLVWPKCQPSSSQAAGSSSRAMDPHVSTKEHPLGHAHIGPCSIHSLTQGADPKADPSQSKPSLMRVLHAGPYPLHMGSLGCDQRAAGVQGPAELRGAGGGSLVGLMPPGRPCLDGTLLLLPWHVSGLSAGKVEGCGHVPARHRVQHGSEQLPCLLPGSPCHLRTRCGKRQPRPPRPCNTLLQTLFPSCPPRLCGCLAPSPPLALLQPPPGLAATTVPPAGGLARSQTAPALRSATPNSRGVRLLLPRPPGWKSPPAAPGSGSWPRAVGLWAWTGGFVCSPGCPRTRPSTFSLVLPPPRGKGSLGREPQPEASAGPRLEAASSPAAGGSLQPRLSPPPPPRGEQAPTGYTVTQPVALTALTHGCFVGSAPSVGSPPPTAADPGGGKRQGPGRLLRTEEPLTHPHTAPPDGGSGRARPGRVTPGPGGGGRTRPPGRGRAPTPDMAAPAHPPAG
ncbi:collagen alpha-1(I) chain-like [Harpia harpyja]|uniref:collagen alpha-1(I) chain-like n=1 Tax=Harpia harpyja TaxID=202280 RepID=UPI0022B204E7|nr:collagen alpha-1(I) chain-like [Harpia harpyja]